MAQTRTKTKKSTPKNSFVKASNQKKSLSLPTGYVGQLTTPTKVDKKLAIITPNTSPTDKMKAHNTMSPMDIEAQKISINNHIN